MLYTPIDMRAPGAAWGLYALECAMDELAYKLGVDTLELRLKNYSDKDHESRQTVFRVKNCVNVTGEGLMCSVGIDAIQNRDP